MNNKAKEMSVSETFELLKKVKKLLYETIRGESEGSAQWIWEDISHGTFNVNITHGPHRDAENNLIETECRYVLALLQEACDKIEYLESPVIGQGTPVKLEDGRYRMPDGKALFGGDPVEVLFDGGLCIEWERAEIVEDYDAQSDTSTFRLAVPDWRESVDPEKEVIRYRDRPY